MKRIFQKDAIGRLQGDFKVLLDAFPISTPIQSEGKRKPGTGYLKANSIVEKWGRALRYGALPYDRV
jgi:hypothetical protein